MGKPKISLSFRLGAEEPSADASVTVISAASLYALDPVAGARLIEERIQRADATLRRRLLEVLGRAVGD